jgi:hypothetical protein
MRKFTKFQISQIKFFIEIHFYSSFETMDSVTLAKEYIFETLLSKVEGEGGRPRSTTITSYHIPNELLRRNSVNMPFVNETTQRERANSAAAFKDEIYQQISAVQKLAL